MGLHFEISKALRPSYYSMHSPHSHSYYELYYLSKGKCTLLLDNNIFSIEEGTMVFIEKGKLHQTSYCGDSVCERIFIEFTEDYLDIFPDTKNWISNNLSGKFLNFSSQDRTTIDAIINKILSEHNSNKLYSNILKKTYFNELIIVILRQYKSAPKVLINRNTLITDLSINQSISYINEHYSEPLTLTLISQKMHLNSSYFSKKFKNVCGIGFRDYLNHVRINHAEQLLLETKLTITEIAFSCGYDNSNYFGDAFRKINSISPTEFRKKRGSFSI